MRWWLAAIFVVIALITATLVATVSSRQADTRVRAKSEEIAVGNTVAAAFAIETSIANGTLPQDLSQVAQHRKLALFVFGVHGRLRSASRSLGISWSAIPNGRDALGSALSDHRYVSTSGETGATVVALPLRRAPGAHALVAFAPRQPAYGRSLAIFHHEVLRASLWALLVAAVAGLVAATLIAGRLRRIGAAAASIERGNFDVQLRPRFLDEVGSLGASIDRMRQRLGRSFEQLRAERDRLGRLLGQLQEGVVAVDPQAVVQFANDRASELTEMRIAPGEHLPEPWPDLSLQALTHGLFRDDAEVAEARIESGDGRALSVVGIPAGASELAVVVLTDITAHERRERAEREFVANASHELRTPVSAITSAVEALQSGAAEIPDDRDRFVELIARQATRLGRLTRSLLIMARAQTREEPVQLEPVQLRPLVDEILASSDVPEGAAVVVRCPHDLIALGQVDIAEQILFNLVGNALKHAADGALLVSARANGETVVVEVTDTGPGIPHVAAERVFDRFYAGGDSKRDGFGLGLAIVRDAVRTLGGSVEIESEPGRGTTARVTLAAVTKP
jgi:signal transduction histidine kinase